MTQYRNIGDETYTDFITGQGAEPDSVINVPDEFAEFYVDHPVWSEVGAVPPAPAPAPVVDVPVEVPAPDDADASTDKDK